MRSWKKCEVYKRNVVTPDELFARILNAAARNETSDGQHAIFAHDLQSALRLTVWDFRTFVVNCQNFAISVFKFFI
jgi:hypothetical protein